MFSFQTHATLIILSYALNIQNDRIVESLCWKRLRAHLIHFLHLRYESLAPQAMDLIAQWVSWSLMFIFIQSGVGFLYYSLSPPFQFYIPIIDQLNHYFQPGQTSSASFLISGMRTILYSKSTQLCVSRYFESLF